MSGLHPFLVGFLLVMVANMAPWASSRLLRGIWAAPLDFAVTLPDGRRLLGSHKTWRGFIAGELACAVTARLCGYPLLLGLKFAALSLAADAASSCLKRRLSLPPGTEVPVLDQLPEALLPLAVLAAPLGISLLDAVAVAVIFLCLDIAAQPLRHSARQR